MTNVLILGTLVNEDSEVNNLIDRQSRTTIIGRNFTDRNVLDAAMKDQDTVIVTIDETSSIDLMPTLVESMEVSDVHNIIVIDKLSTAKSEVERVSTKFLKLSGLNYKILDPID